MRLIFAADSTVLIYSAEKDEKGEREGGGTLIVRKWIWWNNTVALGIESSGRFVGKQLTRKINSPAKQSAFRPELRRISISSESITCTRALEIRFKSVISACCLPEEMAPPWEERSKTVNARAKSRRRCCIKQSPVHFQLNYVFIRGNVRAKTRWK